jgi:hypothetical protein
LEQLLHAMADRINNNKSLFTFSNKDLQQGIYSDIYCIKRLNERLVTVEERD